jgi:hypothetical protein
MNWAGLPSGPHGLAGGSWVLRRVGGTSGGTWIGDLGLNLARLDEAKCSHLIEMAHLDDCRRTRPYSPKWLKRPLLYH